MYMSLQVYPSLHRVRPPDLLLVSLFIHVLSFCTHTLFAGPHAIPYIRSSIHIHIHSTHRGLEVVVCRPHGGTEFCVCSAASA